MPLSTATPLASKVLTPIWSDSATPEPPMPVTRRLVDLTTAMMPLLEKADATAIGLDCGMPRPATSNEIEVLPDRLP